MNDEHVATYIYDPMLLYGVYEVYACYDSLHDRYKRNVSHYDIYDKNGVCVNEGDPFYEMPTWQKVFDTYYTKQVN